MTKLCIKRIAEETYTFKNKIEMMFFENEFVYFLRHIFRFLQRLPKWIGLAWAQENWDFDYLYQLIEVKLKEFKIAQDEDTLHIGSNRYAKQIDICLKRLDRYRNWPAYYDYPMDDITHEQTENGCYKLVSMNEENEKQRYGAHAFIEKNYNKFWKDFLEWHQNWWT